PGDARGVRLTTRVPDGGSLHSLTPLRAGFAFHERETAEMFGIGFDGFTDDTGQGLRPLLLPDGFEGHPLRKSFQLAARASKTWPGGKEPGEGHDSAKSPSRRRVQAPGVPPPEWGPR
ncbi:MAG: NADH-quinone oxidoreductase subunit C, partial [Tetrasphaera sp.]|nr:NADH-quinone oxidoreductase subunit C [Tetrasphaera sp.]